MKFFKEKTNLLQPLEDGPIQRVKFCLTLPVQPSTDSFGGI